MTRRLVLAVALAGCAAGGNAVRPARVVLYEDTLTVEMSDASLCAGPRNAAGRGWQGHLQGCPHRWPFATRLPAGRLSRAVLTPDAAGVAGADVTAPGGAVLRYGAR